MSGPSASAERWEFWSNPDGQTQALRVALTLRGNAAGTNTPVNLVSIPDYVAPPPTFPLQSPLRDWRPRDTYARLTDGASNTALIAEKHITPGLVYRCCFDKHAVNPADPLSAGKDGFPYWNRENGPGGYGLYWVTGSAWLGVARTPRHGEGLSFDASPAIGSWHPGLCNFLMADGAVKALDANTPTAAVVKLVSVADGAADLP